MMRIGFLASHGGSNMQAIINACKTGELNAVPAALVSNNSDSGAVKRAIAEGIPYYHISSKNFNGDDERDKAIIDAFDANGVDTVCLAGYMKRIGQKVIEHFNRRVLNIHPALLPKFGGKGMFGLNVHKAVLAAGEKTSGATVHLVNNEFDAGKILAQTSVKVEPDYTAESLAARILVEEHILYSATLKKISEGLIIIP